ncbi:PREDICTED: uncharacterized protein LOC18593232 isoform X1 [Theobroma cacao]|uniref:Uncharacterized protein LOC18593232 isoform X1 n=1 Tax=Theobroma cacao TaxID=3641 RepID=A0AB32UXA8_THECC|nr:PREDICTED: uncharacterized protein LOC18593232 isoform X1 [Theobroma cacao]
MGKRKERRLAALSNAGRRVKLDLFAEPSEDLGGSSVHEEVDGEPKHGAGLPNSPSSSGQQPPNPLLLLGQYSDDELDDESDKRLEHGTLDGSLSDHDDQAKGPLSETCKDAEVDAGVRDTLKVNQQNTERDSTPNAIQNLVGVDNREGDNDDASESVKKNDSTEQISVAGTSEVQVIGDVGSGWRIVMHEESNQYYYWNVETGETSWEVPNVLAPINLSTSGQMALTVENMETAQVGTQDCKSTLSAQPTGGNLIPQNNEPRLDEQDGGCKSEALKDNNWTSDVNRSEFQSSSDAVDTHLTDGSLSGSGNYVQNLLANVENKSGIDLSTHLLKQGECLLERMKSLKVSEDDLQGQGWMSNCILEVEIRLSDIKSLLSYGSSLSPFWAHCERKLKQLEGIINDKIYQLAKSAIMEEGEETPASFGEKLKSEESTHNEVEADGNGYSPVSSTPDISHVSTDVDTLTVVNSDSKNQVPSSNAACMVKVPSFGSPTEHCESQAQIGQLVNEDTLSGEANSKTGGLGGEDVDMDVDMEVEEAIPASTMSLRDVSPTTLEQLNPPADYSAVPPPPDEEWIPPPPPDNEQVPPPPPDNEQVPPPPPDEPPEHSYPPPPSYAESVPLTYAEQYNLTYSDSSYQYYGHAVSEVPIGSFYGHADGSQVAAPQASIYYQAVPNTYSESAPVTVNPVEPVTFYDLQGGGATSVPIAVGTEATQLYSEAGTITYNTLASSQIRFDDELAVAGPGVRGNVPTGSDKTEVASAGISSTLATIEAPATISIKESFAAAAAAAASAAVAASSSGPKVSSKAARTKKRTVAATSSLRSNKKVSSLVDKWKAAKEELHENAEDEPENPYAMLERKRQREIEEWRAQQIASGEAKDNANFQPLGGDWREKVKRRRAQQKAKEAAETPAEVVPDGNEQPDLDELSRDLPSGWQAYWDETSKQVYYGNVNTSETTWIRPTK